MITKNSLTHSDAVQIWMDLFRSGQVLDGSSWITTCRHMSNCPPYLMTSPELCFALDQSGHIVCDTTYSVPCSVYIKVVLLCDLLFIRAALLYIRAAVLFWQRSTEHTLAALHLLPRCLVWILWQPSMLKHSTSLHMCVKCV